MFKGLRVLITGGAGFIGSNLAYSLLESGCDVTVLDDLSREGVRNNIERLSSHPLKRNAVLQILKMDVSSCDLAPIVADVDFVFHIAGQTAATTSIVDPLNDFRVNVQGTLNVLEAIRKSKNRPGLLFTSTNKVYGGLDDIELMSQSTSWVPSDTYLREQGISESRQLSFESPYGCSKGAADQYVLDYGRCYGLSVTVFRMSCIYGPYQYGTADQGWITHLLRTTLAGKTFTVYGDGKQVRDVLYIDDLVGAMRRVFTHPISVRGKAFNIGGGPANAISLLESIDIVSKELGFEPSIAYASPRLADQRWYVSDTTRFTLATGWRPLASRDVYYGVKKIADWLQS